MAAGERRISGLEGFLLLVLGGFAIVFIVRAQEFGRTAALFPRVVAGLSLGILLAMLAVRFLQKRGGKVSGKPAEEQQSPDAVSWPAALGVQGVYVAMIVLLGFPLATFIYLLSSPLQMRYRRWAVVTPYALLMTVAVTISFVYLFHVRLPEPLLWQWLNSSR